MGTNYGPRIVTDNLECYIDAFNSKSYITGSSKVNDLSRNKYQLDINPNVLQNENGINFFDFGGSYGCAKRVVGGGLSNVELSANSSICIFSKIKVDQGDWRTLSRGASQDHQTLIQSSTNYIGYYDNLGSDYISSNYDITNITNYNTAWNFYCFNFSSSSPYWSMYLNNESTPRATITVAASNPTYSFSAIGGYHNESTDVNATTQFWGKIVCFMAYNKQLSLEERLQNYNALKGRFGL